MTFFDRALREEPLARLVEEDPDLFAGLPPPGRLDARARAVAPVLRLECGPWAPPVREPNGAFGLLILEGLLIHSTVVAHEPRGEVVGPGDVLRPWQQEPDVASVPFATEWRVVERARLAVLDTRFVAFATRWPALFTKIVERTVRRANWLALQLAITDVRRVEDRLMLFFWHLADRWGRVGRDGVAVPLPVTHEVLAQLVCAQRPTVTSALRRLRDQGRLSRRPDRSWLLAAEPPARPARASE